jgi:dimethylhistidine N-methyltransferase
MLKKLQKQKEQNFQFVDLHPPVASLKEEVIAGLSQKPKSLSPKWFYDERGSNLFNQITRCPEYYLTKTEISILNTHLEEILSLIGENPTIIEYGCGDSEKVEILLSHLPLASGYIPLDISRNHLLSLAERISENFPALEVTAVCSDFTKPMDLPFLHSYYSKKVAFFPGSSIGNFEPPQAGQLLNQIHQLVGPGGGLLIGVDLIKDPNTLNLAYNDQAGYTANFNLNLLDRINRECRANFERNRFQHHAFYNPIHHRIEMHLVSQKNQRVKIGDYPFTFKKDESIHTENSYKYDLPSFHLLAKKAGWTPVQTWTDPKNLFSIHYLQIS